MKNKLVKDELHLLKAVCLQTENAINVILEPYNLTAAQADVMKYAMLHENGEMISSDIHEQFHISRANISSIIKRLRSKGYLEFKMNPKDNRQKQIIVTEEARNMEAELDSCIERLKSVLFKDLTVEEVICFQNALVKMEANLSGENRRNRKNYDKNDFKTDKAI